MKKILVSLMFLFAIGMPLLSFADAGHAAGEPHMDAHTQSGAVHVHDDGSFHDHGTEGFELATPWSSRWWILVGISLILMGLLSISVDKYLRVQ